LFLKKTIKDYQIKSVLEIGAAIGYSAIFMALEGCHVTTFERNKTMIELAKKHIKPYQNHIELIAEDALLFDGDLGMFDMIFIDAAKAQYQKFFEKFTPYLKQGGIVVCDNLSFHNLDIHKVSRSTRQLIQKLERFKTYLETHPDYQTIFYDVGDGMSITKRVE